MKISFTRTSTLLFLSLTLAVVLYHPGKTGNVQEQSEQKNLLYAGFNTYRTMVTAVTKRDSIGNSGPKKDSTNEKTKTNLDSIQTLNLDTLRSKMDSLLTNQKTNSDFVSSYIFYTQIGIIVLLIIVIIVFFSMQKKSEQKLDDIIKSASKAVKENTNNLRVNDVGTLSASFKDFRDIVFPRAINNLTGLINGMQERTQTYNTAPAPAPQQNNQASSQSKVEILYADLMDQPDGWSEWKLGTTQKLYMFEFNAGKSEGIVTLNLQLVTNGVIDRAFSSFPDGLFIYRNGLAKNAKDIKIVSKGRVTRNGQKVTVVEKIVIDFIN